MHEEWKTTEEADIGARGELLVLTSIGVAALFQVSRQWVSQLAKAGQLPEPCILVNGSRPGWLPSQFDTTKLLAEQVSTTTEDP
jgi:hypothetical protein